MSDIKVKLTKPSNEKELFYSYSSNQKTLYFKTPNYKKYTSLQKDYFPTFFNLFLKATSLHYTRMNYYILELEAHLDNVCFKSEEYRNKLLAEMKQLNRNQFFEFLESERYRNFAGKRYNPFLEIIRIRNGLPAHDVVAYKPKMSCNETIVGFLDAIESKTLRIIKYKEGNIVTYLFVKTKTGPTDAINKIALDPISLDIYSIVSNKNKDNPYEITYLDNLGHMRDSENEIRLKRNLGRYINKINSQAQINKTRTEMKAFIKKNKDLFKRKPIKSKVL